MKCIKCGADLTDEMFSCGMCFSCGCAISESEEAYQVEQARIKAETELVLRRKKEEHAERFRNHMLTTGYSFDGYRIAEYIGIVTGETVMGTGYLSDICASVSDFFGAEASEYSEKLRVAKQTVLKTMIKNSTDLGGNAVIGVSYGFMAFSGNMMGVSVTGTSVKVERYPDNM